ncbi:MAG: flagellar basal body L-ring protein FlgH [Bryobacterales bacterium]|nr:flagellar basal body L-ring protein FlgH [Bryobacterales bacterium]
MRVRWSVALVTACLAAGADKGDRPATPLERWIQGERERGRQGTAEGTPGAIWRPDAVLADAARDVVASRRGDIVTIVVSERASAVARGATKAQRQAQTEHSVAALFGPVRAGSRLADLGGLSGASALDGQGATSRDTVLTTTISARVVEVLPNGHLVLEGAKETVINSERQWVTVRGVVRPYDISPGNLVRSDRIAMLEVRINGKGVVGDAVRRPFFLYRLLMGLWPF